MIFLFFILSSYIHARYIIIVLYDYHHHIHDQSYSAVSSFLRSLGYSLGPKSTQMNAPVKATGVSSYLKTIFVVYIQTVAKLSYSRRAVDASARV